MSLIFKWVKPVPSFTTLSHHRAGQIYNFYRTSEGINPPVSIHVNALPWRPQFTDKIAYWFFRFMDEKAFHKVLIDNFGHVPTKGQDRLLYATARLLFSVRDNCAFIIRGYAGTGKTTSVKAIVESLKLIGQRSVLLAPTGRAAKVLANYSGRPAFTIHKKIYQLKTTRDGVGVFQLRSNLHKKTLFIVDEASMIGTLQSSVLSSRDLLSDLLEFVFSGENCRLLLIGDDAQLPPVGSDHSPALDMNYMLNAYPLTVAQTTLTEVKRQALTSGILYNATMLREQLLDEKTFMPQLHTRVFDDVIRVEGHELQDELENAINEHGIEGTVMVTRSNKRANLFNQQIRHRVLWKEDRINAGDYMMVVKNNYFWLDEEKSQTTSFIANGDTLEIMKIARYEERYGFEFATAEVRLLDYPDLPPMEVVLLLDTIMGETANLGPEKSKALYHCVAEDYIDLADRKKIHQAVMDDPFYNALQVKFAYAITCHKSQGGQWPAVFVDQGYINDDMLDKEFIRWLYTAITRAQQKLFLVNWDEKFFDEDEREGQ